MEFVRKCLCIRAIREIRGSKRLACRLSGLQRGVGIVDLLLEVAQAGRDEEGGQVLPAEDAGGRCRRRVCWVVIVLSAASGVWRSLGGLQLAALP